MGGPAGELPVRAGPGPLAPAPDRRASGNMVGGMPGSRIDYQAMVQRALRSVLREVMALVAEEGPPGEHHFYLSFRTRAEGVQVPPFLADRYPDEITIVLQNQFWDLHVDEAGLSVVLAFDGTRQRIGVPWEAITAFIDPVAEFALRFEGEGAGAPGRAREPGGDAPEEEAAGSRDASADVVNISKFRKGD